MDSRTKEGLNRRFNRNFFCYEVHLLLCCHRQPDVMISWGRHNWGPPKGVSNHAITQIFLHFHAITHGFSRHHTNWSHFSSFTQSRTDFFRFHAITQIRKGFSRHHAHQKDLSRITHTCQLHAITQLFFHFHAITQFSRNKKGHSRNHANLWGGLLHIIYHISNVDKTDKHWHLS